MSLAAASPLPPRAPAQTPAGAQTAARASAHAAFLQWLDQEEAEPPVSGGTATEATSRPAPKPPAAAKSETKDAGAAAAIAQEAGAAAPNLALMTGLPLASAPIGMTGVAGKVTAADAPQAFAAAGSSGKTPDASQPGAAAPEPDDEDPAAQALGAAASGPGGAAPGGSAAQPLLQAAADAGATLVRAKAEPGEPVAPTLPFDGAPPDGSAAVLSTPLREGGGNPAPVLARTRGATASAAATQTAKPVGTASASASAGDVLALSSATARDEGGTGGDGRGASDPGQGEVSADEAAPGGDAADLGLGMAGQAPLAAFSPTLQAAPAATPLSATAADLAAQMAARVSTGASRFQLQLDPLGLGRVDVNVSIGADRQLTAQLAFADAQTAHALSAHAGELKSALEQAGFSVPAHGFDFTAPAGPLASGAQAGSGSGQGGGFAGQDSSQSGGGRSASAAFSAGETLAGSTAVSASAWAGGGGDSRLDIRI